MSATQERSRPNIWAVGVRQVVYMALGAALYGGLSYLTNFLQLPSVGNVSLRPAIVIPLFFGAVFGPIVGLISGGLGNFIGDLISGYGVYLNWDIGNGLIGLFAGLASLSLFNIFGRYNNVRAIAIAEVLSAVGVVVGIAFAAYTDIWFSKLNFAGATSEFIPAAAADLFFGLVLLPFLLVAYYAAVGRRGMATGDGERVA